MRVASTSRFYLLHRRPEDTTSHVVQLSSFSQYHTTSVADNQMVKNRAPLKHVIERGTNVH
jgi:hypothetical protein